MLTSVKETAHKGLHEKKKKYVPQKLHWKEAKPATFLGERELPIPHKYYNFLISIFQNPFEDTLSIFTQSHH